jgi:hypothetical protein
VTTVAMLIIRNIYEHLRLSARKDSVYGALCRGSLRLLSPAERRVTAQQQAST